MTDLHLHTPASSCFTGEKVTPKKYVKKCIDVGLEVIAITDHNTAGWIDDIIAEASSTSLVVFPGVEITSSAGIHILAIFDITKRSKDIEYLLNQLKIHPDQYGKSTAISKLSEIEILDEIEKVGAISILPHIDDIRGAFKDLQPTPKKNLFNCSKYMAVECDTSELPEKFTKKFGFNRHPPVIQSSDNPNPNDKRKHSLDGIGSRYTLLKLDEKVDLEGLMQCFFDPDVRLKEKEKFKPSRFARIIDLKASDGFMKHQNVRFHSGLNSIIGGKGVGKSLIVEYIRFVLNQESNDDEIRNDHLGKLEKQLGYDNFVEASIELESGARYRLKKTFSDNPEFKCINESTGEEYQGDINKLFRVLCYSQTEVLKISEKPRSQIELIDSFIDNTRERQTIKEITKKLGDNDKNYAKSLRAEIEYNELRTEIATLKEKISDINSQLSPNNKASKVFSEYQKYESKKYTFENQIEFLEDLGSIVDFWDENIKDLEVPDLPSDVASDKQLLADINVIKGSIKKITSGVTDIGLTIKKANDLINAKYEKWLVSFKKKEQEYKKSVSNEDEKKKLNVQRKRLTDEKNKLNNKIVKCRGEKKKSTILSERKILIKSFLDAHSQIYNNRKAKYAELTKISNNKIRLKLTNNANRKKYLNRLVELLRGANVRKSQTEAIVDNFLPHVFVPIVITKQINKLANGANLSVEVADKIIMKIQTSYSFEEILELEYGYSPEDVPVIEYRIAKQEYSPLNEISTGQKCTALLIIALSDGTCPVIMDQPEDALDITTVWEDVSQNLRSSKEQRQFIITTHNPSVAVSSDTDMYIAIRSNAKQANVKCLGAIDVKDAKKEVIKHLEGGLEPYELRKHKYSVDRLGMGAL